MAIELHVRGHDREWTPRWTDAMDRGAAMGGERRARLDVQESLARDRCPCSGSAPPAGSTSTGWACSTPIYDHPVPAIARLSRSVAGDGHGVTTGYRYLHGGFLRLQLKGETNLKSSTLKITGWLYQSWSLGMK